MAVLMWSCFKGIPYSHKDEVFKFQVAGRVVVGGEGEGERKGQVTVNKYSLKLGLGPNFPSEWNSSRTV